MADRDYERELSRPTTPTSFRPLPTGSAQGGYSTYPTPDFDPSTQHLMTPTFEKDYLPADSSYQNQTHDQYSTTPTSTSSSHRLLPWSREAFPFYGLLLAVIMQAALLAIASWLTRDPVLLPTGRYLFNKISLKNFNVTITVLGALVGGLAAYGIATGARSFLSRKLLSGGLTLTSYKRFAAIGSGSVIHRLSSDGLISLTLLVLAGLASSAVVGVFSASLETQTLDLLFQYPTVGLNPDFYSDPAKIQATVLQSAEDFDAFTNIAARYLLAGLHVNETVSFIENVATSPSDGIVVSILPVVTFTSAINSSYIPLTSLQKNIVSNSTENTYRFAAPAAVSNSSCTLATDLTTSSSLAGQHLILTVTDAVCGASEVAFRLVNQTLAGALICTYPTTGTSVNDGATRIVYYTANPITRVFQLGAACTSRTYAGNALGLTYGDTGNTLSRDPDTFQVTELIDATSLAATILASKWVNQIGAVGNPALEFLISGMRQPFTLNPAFEYESYTSTMLSLGVAKLVSTEGYNWAYAGNTLTDASKPLTRPFFTELKSAAYLIGPQGYNKLWMIVIGLTFLELVGALWVTWKWPIVALNPLDPVSVLLVAQNSPATVHAKGGSLGKVEQLPNPAEKIRYRAVGDTQLGFTWGNHDYHEPPVIGRLYG